MPEHLDIEYRPLTVDTIDEQIKLLDIAFTGSAESNEKSATRRSMLHKHYENPRRVGEVGFGAFYEGKPVGMSFFMADKFIYQGETFTAVQGCDAAVHPDFQRRGIQTRCIQMAEEYYASIGVDFIWAFRNSHSIGVYEKREFVATEHDTHVYFPLNPFVLAKRFVLKKQTNAESAVQLPHTTTVRQGRYKGFSVCLSCQPEDCFFDNFSSGKRISVLCDKEYFEWRLQGYGFFFCTVRDAQNRPVATFIMKVEGICAKMLSYTFYSESTDVQKKAIFLLLHEMRKDMRCGVLSFLVGNTADLKVMKKCGGIQHENTLYYNFIKVLTDHPEKRKILSDTSLWNLQRIAGDLTIDNFDTPEQSATTKR